MIVVLNLLEVYGNTLNNDGVIDSFPANGASFKLKQKITGKMKIMVQKMK